jgi:site-specific recombinase XerD
MKKPLLQHPLPALLQDFFCEHLQSQRRVSPQTIASYRDTIRLLLLFAQQQLHRPPSQQCLEDWNVSLVLGFLNYLEKTRHNCVRTRNARLAAIHSFMEYVGQKLPETLGVTARLLAIPTKRFDRPLLGYLSKPEVRVLLQTPSRPTWTERRNQLLWLLLYHTGARISEVLALDRQDIQWTPSPAAHLHGKGRKERLVPLRPQVAAVLKEWLRQLPEPPDTPLLPNRFGKRLTRYGAYKHLQRLVKRAAPKCPSLARTKLSPHTLRHTTAMHLLQAGVDITVIALWLGHESPATTHQYIELDLKMKRKCLANLAKPKTTPKAFKPTDRVLRFLQSL